MAKGYVRVGNSSGGGGGSGSVCTGCSKRPIQPTHPPFPCSSKRSAASAGSDGDDDAVLDSAAAQAATEAASASVAVMQSGVSSQDRTWLPWQRRGGWLSFDNTPTHPHHHPQSPQCPAGQSWRWVA